MTAEGEIIEITEIEDEYYIVDFTFRVPCSKAPDKVLTFMLDSIIHTR